MLRNISTRSGLYIHVSEVYVAGRGGNMIMLQVRCDRYSGQFEILNREESAQLENGEV